jgi:glyoxylase-like metal-dependent hydrolase (beta-lactamase superfamily II)
VRRTPREARRITRGVYRLGSRWANFYLVVDGDEALLIDAGYPGYFKQLKQATTMLGFGLETIRAVLVTHHHVDHAGTAGAVRAHADAAVLVHENDAPKVRGERPSHPPSGFYRKAWRLSMIRYLAHTVRAGGAKYRPVPEVETLGEERVLDLPGRPRVVPTHGHTAGHCSVFLQDRGMLFAGDAMVNFDYATGKAGVKLHRFNEDRETARASLHALAAFDADTVLFGHGDPWTQGLDRAVEMALNAA